MTRVGAGARNLDETCRKKRQDKLTSSQKKDAATAVVKEAPDGEGPFLPHNTPEEGGRELLSSVSRPAVNLVDVVAEEDSLTPPTATRDAVDGGCKGSKGGKKGKTTAMKSDDAGKKKVLSGTSPKKGKAKQRSKASKTKPGKAERGGGSSDPNLRKGKDEADNNNNNNIDDHALSSRQQIPEMNSISVKVNLVEHDISELQIEMTSRRNGASSSRLNPSRDLSGFNDCLEGMTSCDVISNNNSHKNGLSNNSNEIFLSLKEQDTPEKPLSVRYSVMPPMTIPREGRKEHTQQKDGASKNASVHTSRAPSAPSVSLASGNSSGADTNGEKFARRSAHSSLEEALDGLLPKNILYPTRQLLTRSLASAAEKERTATIVFDLDETLCNNRQHGPAILRPGAAEMLKQLRALYPHPVMHKGETPMEPTGKNASTKVMEGGKKNSTQNCSPEATETPTDDGVMLRLEIIIWTASVEVVARPVIARLDPDGTILDDVIYRDVRWYRDGGYTKDLRRIGRHLERNVIVENAPSCVSMNRRNAILVNDFVSNPADRQLVIVRAILQEWLYNVNALLVHWHFQKLKQKRQNMIEDGGESPEPDKPMIAPLTRGGSAHSSVSKSKGELSLVSSSHGGGNLLQELEQKASAIHFLTHHPFLSPGTRYVKPSVWKKAARYLHGCAGSTTATANPVMAMPAAMAGEIGGGRGLQELPATTPARPVVSAKPRGHRSFVDMARGPREVR
ncbi:hypothetical protein MOQ_003630 [Trypanosoma cruzi marinkellei]|uniref:FCP1 homology domain-containing protein n=1 Tax=Trypanosoma cruzi marinkellei TaxID=85056 RepID=K2NU77_TRYCR|nr:hypothetical protein MOQ_003630 [Trypanosoma cruzi marinkellei]